MKNINTPNFFFEFIPIESIARGTLLYIATHLAYQNQNYLTLYEKDNLELTFMEMKK